MADEQFLNPQERISRDLEREFHKDVPPGENVDATAPRTEAMGLTADALKDLHDRLPGLTDAELKRIPIEPEAALAPKSATDYLVWNRIVGVESPEQLDQPPDTPLP